MNYTQAKTIADYLVGLFAPHCERVAIAGSIRREKSEPKDIEIVAIPKFVPEQRGIFTGVDFPDDPSPTVSALDPVLAEIGTLVKGGPRYKQFMLREGIHLDLFLVLPPGQWGVQFTIRTGPGDFSKWLVTSKRQSGALPSYLSVHDGALWNGKDLVPTPEEIDFFDAIGLQWIEPCKRVPAWRKAP